MTNTVYVAYNWLGPEGPMENICTPDLYDLALQENHDMITVDIKASRAYPTEFGQRCVHSHDRFKITGTAGMTESDVFVYPITLGWKDNMQTLFDMENGIFERSRLPGRTLDLIRHHGGYLLLEHGWECFCTDQDFDLIHRYVRYHDIPYNKIIYITGTANATEVYEKYCHSNGVDSKINIISYFPALEGYTENITDVSEPVYQTDYVPSKRFLSLNYRPRPHRTVLLALFSKHNLLADSYFSFCGMHEDQDINTTYQERHTQGLDISQTDIDALIPVLGDLILDNRWPEYYGDVLYDMENTDIMQKYYEDSLVNIVTETNFYDDIISATEKSFKAIRYMQPFVMVAAPGSLKNLNNLGFKTFSDFWDESYDQEKNPAQRLKNIMLVCNQISKWTPSEIKDFRTKVKPILKHNFRMLKNWHEPQQTYQNIVDTVTQENIQ